MSFGRVLVVLLFAALCVACSSDSEKLSKEVQDANSWIASARMVAKAYGDGAVPKAYTHDSLQSFNQQLQSTVTEIQSMSDSRAAETAAALQRAQHAIAEIDGAVERGDHLSLAQFDVQLDNEQKQLTNPPAPVRQP